MDDGLGQKFAAMLEHNRTLIHFDYSFNNFSVYTANKIKECIRRNVGEYKGNKLMEWRERKL
jgi:hypothetical protein